MPLRKALSRFLSDLHRVGRGKAMSFSLHPCPVQPMELAGVKGMTQRENSAVSQVWEMSRYQCSGFSLIQVSSQI